MSHELGGVISANRSSEKPFKMYEFLKAKEGLKEHGSEKHKFRPHPTPNKRKYFQREKQMGFRWHAGQFLFG